VNLRILKKLSKKAAPLLPLLGDNRQQFAAERGDNYMSVLIRDRKHWERGASAHNDRDQHGTIKWKPRNPEGRKYPWSYMTPPRQPRKGTVMVGATSGYYEPEWDEQTAWEALEGYVYAHFTDWSVDQPVVTRKFNGPGDILRAARELAEQSA
jgi:hypothetical protein